MTEAPKHAWTRETKRDKAATTTAAALDIIGKERGASDVKVARLKALRLASSPRLEEKLPAAKATQKRAAKPSSVFIREIGMQGGQKSMKRR